LKKRKRREKAEGEASAAAAEIPRIQKFDDSDTKKGGRKKSQDSKEESGEDSDNDSKASERSRIDRSGNEKPKGPGAPESEQFELAFDPDWLGLPEDATEADVRTSIENGKLALQAQKGQEDRIALLEQRLLDRATAQLAAVPVTIMSDLNQFHITTERITAEGFKKLREKTEALEASGSTLDRNKLISTDASKLIGQLLAAMEIPDFENWEKWENQKFYEVMSQIYPSGNSVSIKHLHDFLQETKCEWVLSDHPTSLLRFIAQINEAVRIYQSELDSAKEKGNLAIVQKECVIALLNRITASSGDSSKEPAGVRARLRAKMLHGGKPADMARFISKILQQAGVIYAASEEMQACGITYRPFARTKEPAMGKRALKLEANRIKNEENAKGRLPGFGGWGALPKEFVEFICNGCGGKGHAIKQCPLRTHKDFNTSKLAWAKSEAGVRLKLLGKSAISGDAAAGAKHRGECNFVHDAPLLATLCASNDHYFVPGVIFGTGANTTDPNHPTLTVQVLPDTGAVIDNYCSEAVGDWVRLRFPECWDANSNSDTVNLACRLCF
jgi:hypothetical protein